MPNAVENNLYPPGRICGLESINVRRLRDLRGRDAWELMHEINLAAGRPIWRPPLALQALQNLVDAAEREHSRPPAPTSNAVG